MSEIANLSINIFNSLPERVRSWGTCLISYFPKNSSIAMTALKVCALGLFGVVVGLGCRWMLSRRAEKSKIETFREAFEAKFPAKTQAGAEESWNTFYKRREGKDFEAWGKELRECLLGLAAYKEKQAAVVEIVSTALQGVLENPGSEEHKAFAKDVYKGVAEFLRENSGDRTKAGYRAYLEDREGDGRTGRVTPVGMFIGDIQGPGEKLPVGFANRQTALMFLLRQLRGQVKRAYKQERLQKKLQENVAQEMFNKALPYLGLTWIHGTKGSVINATDGVILPTGKLKERNIQIKTGECGGVLSFTHLSNYWVSGVHLVWAEESIRYATDFQFDESKKKETYEDFIQKKAEGSYWIYSDWVEAASFMKMHYPERFEQDRGALKQKATAARKSMEDQLARPLTARYGDCPGAKIGLDIEMHRINSEESWPHDLSVQVYNQIRALEDLERLLNSPSAASAGHTEAAKWGEIPAVLASGTKYGLPRDHKNQVLESYEDLQPQMVLERDIQVIFTTDEHVEVVRGLVEEKGLSIQVESMEVLKAAQKVDQALYTYLYDVYNIRKLEKIHN